MEAVAIVGGGGHGTDILHDLRAQGVAVGGFFDDQPGRGNLGSFVEWADASGPWLLGLNDPTQRWALAGKRRGAFNNGIWVHRDASVGPTVILGDHTHVNAGVTITRTMVGECCTISPNATICGDVTIGNRVSIGAGATICQFAHIGDDVKIGAGAVVKPWEHLEAGTWVGVPVRAI